MCILHTFQFVLMVFPCFHMQGGVPLIAFNTPRILFLKLCFIG
uniref:Uncharacterized protein n=1 Tax=Anguilla anguilla TaxID=7936 RepID=A0A0E9XXT9_ANGAN